MDELPDDLLKPEVEGGQEPDLGEETPGETDGGGGDGIRGSEHLGLTPPD